MSCACNLIIELLRLYWSFLLWTSSFGFFGAGSCISAREARDCCSESQTKAAALCRNGPGYQTFGCNICWETRYSNHISPQVAEYGWLIHGLPGGHEGPRCPRWVGLTVTREMRQKWYFPLSIYSTDKKRTLSINCKGSCCPHPIIVPPGIIFPGIFPRWVM